MWENGLEMKLEVGMWENEIVKMQLDVGVGEIPGLARIKIEADMGECMK